VPVIRNKKNTVKHQTMMLLFSTRHNNIHCQVVLEVL
jgi:hypothetical protein